MEAGEKARAQAHAAACPLCAMRLQEERGLLLGLRALAAEDEERDAPATVEAALLAAFRAEAANREAAPLPDAPRLRRVPWLLVAAAALLVACGLLVYRAARREPAPAPVAKSDVPVAPATDALPETTVAAAPIRRAPRAARSVPAPTPLVQIRDEMTLYAGEGGGEVTTEFLSLDYSENPAPMEAGQVIRVEMPRAALAKFGLPVDVERAHAPVKADLLLGEDGFARAIRFVR